MSKDTTIAAILSDFDKWFNHGTKDKPHGLLASDYYKEVKEFFKSKLLQIQQETEINYNKILSKMIDDHMDEISHVVGESEYDEGYFDALKQVKTIFLSQSKKEL